MLKDYQGSVHNTYHVGHIETYHHLMEVIYNDTATRDKFSINGLVVKKIESYIRR